MAAAATLYNFADHPNEFLVLQALAGVAFQCALYLVNVLVHTPTNTQIA